MSPVKTPTVSETLYTLRDITARGKFSKTYLYKMVAEGRFPAPDLRAGPRFTRWTSARVDQWFADPRGWMDARQHADAGEVAR